MHGISVIIPVFNRQEFIAEAIRSVLDQNYSGVLEIIISDDGSTDKTLDIVKSFGSRVKIIEKESDAVSYGASGARNRGLKAVTQPYVCFLDSDDFYLPGHLNRIAEALDENQNIGFVFCKTLMYKEELGAKLYKRWTLYPVLQKDIVHPSVSRALVVSTNVLLFRREVFQSVGRFNEDYTNSEDIDMWMRISEQYRGKFLDYYGAVYRVNHGFSQLTRTAGDNINRSSFMVYKDAIDRFYRLRLKSQFRIFSLKRSYFYYKYTDRKYLYRMVSFFLLLRYPLGFIQRIPVFYNGFIDRRRNRDWHDLEYFLKGGNN